MVQIPHPAVLLVSATLLLGAGTAPVAGTHSSAGSSAQAQRTKGLTVPNGRSLPQPFLCTAHPVFRFQATYLSNL